MTYSEQISRRLYLWAKEQADLRGERLDEFTRKTMHCGASFLLNAYQGGKTVSLQACDLAIANGCEPSYLFLGQSCIEKYDKVKCFSHGSNDTCRVLNVKKCEGYDRCKFYKSEAEYIQKGSKR